MSLSQHHHDDVTRKVLLGHSVKDTILNPRVDAYVDNTALMHAWGRQGCRDIHLSRVMKEIFVVVRDQNVDSNLHYVKSLDNPTDHSPANRHPTTGLPLHAGEPARDLQGKFSALKDMLSRIRLDPKYKLNESRNGINREDQFAFNILSWSARYGETKLKILSHLQSPTDVTQLDLEISSYYKSCAYEVSTRRIQRPSGTRHVQLRCEPPFPILPSQHVGSHC